MSDTTLDRLSKPFDPAMLRTVEKSGARLSYIPVAEVIARLNEVLETNWSYQVLDRWAAGERETDTGTYPLMCMAHVRLTVTDADSGEIATRDGIGGQPVKFLKNGTGPVDLGDEWKGAVSDALKKAAQHFGVGLELARKEEAIAAEAAEKQRAEHETALKSGGWESQAEHDEAFGAVKARAAQLDDTSKGDLRAWWDTQQFVFPLTRAQVDEYDATVTKLEQHNQRPFDEKETAA